MGRLTFKLFWDEAPLAADNFRALCTGEKGEGAITGKLLHYKGAVTDNKDSKNLIMCSIVVTCEETELFVLSVQKRGL